MDTKSSFCSPQPQALIAAAPDLLEACQVALGLLERVTALEDYDGGLLGAAKLCSYAIAKATADSR